MPTRTENWVPDSTKMKGENINKENEGKKKVSQARHFSMHSKLLQLHV